MAQTKDSLIKNITLSIFAAIIIIYVLFSGPPVGLSDNGDFERVLYSNGLDYSVPAEQRRFIYQNNFHIAYRGDTEQEKILNALFHVEDFQNYPSIQNVFIKLSIGANILLNNITGADNRIYRIEVLGLIYTFLYGLALFALFSSIRIKRQWLDVALKLFIIIMLCDVGYVLYFNSLYGEALQVFSLFNCLWHHAHKVRRRNYLLFILSMLLWSKLQYTGDFPCVDIFCPVFLCYLAKTDSL